MRMTLVILAVLFAVSWIALNSPEQKVDLRIGVLKTVDTIHPFIAEQQGYYKSEGLTYRLYSFGTSPALAEAIASGEIDIAYMSFAPTATWISKGTKMKILSGASRGGDIVCVRETDYDPKGRLAVSKKGTMTETIYRAIVMENVSFQPIYGIEPADMPTALLVTKDVDAALTWEPFASSIEDAGGSCILDAGEMWKAKYGTKYQRNVLVATERALSNKTLIEKVLRIHKRTMDFLNSPGSDAAIAQAMNIAPLKKRRMEFNSTLDWASMQRVMEALKSGGYLKDVLSKEQLIYEG